MNVIRFASSDVPEYPKIETLWNRDPQTHFVVPGVFRCPEFNLVKRWTLTEKIHGMNIRIHLCSDGSVQYGGRTEKAQLSDKLIEYLSAQFEFSRVSAAFHPGAEATLYGEAYGFNIQKGTVYSPTIKVRIFDIKVGRWWLEQNDVIEIANKIGCDCVPVLGYIDFTTHIYTEHNMLPKTYMNLLDLCVGGRSVVADQDSGSGCMMEGIVARTCPLLLMRNGQRLMWKLKLSDFAKPDTISSTKNS